MTLLLLRLLLLFIPHTVGTIAATAEIVVHLFRAVLEQSAVTYHRTPAVSEGKLRVILVKLYDALVVHELGHEDRSLPV